MLWPMCRVAILCEDCGGLWCWRGSAPPRRRPRWRSWQGVRREHERRQRQKLPWNASPGGTHDATSLSDRQLLSWLWRDHRIPHESRGIVHLHAKVGSRFKKRLPTWSEGKNRRTSVLRSSATGGSVPYLGAPGSGGTTPTGSWVAPAGRPFTLTLTLVFTFAFALAFAFTGVGAMVLM
jgi:hypothetical protein